MTKLLERAFEAASELSNEEQDALAARLLEELEWEKSWETAFDRDPAKIKRLAAQANDEIAAGRLRPFDPDDL